MSDTTLQFTVDLVDRQPVLDHYKPPEGKEDECCAMYVDAICQGVMHELMQTVCPLVTLEGNTVSLLFMRELSSDEQAQVTTSVTSIVQPGIQVSAVPQSLPA